eukprot:1876359-Lingulodinium_polyedra.AAC.1
MPRNFASVHSQQLLAHAVGGGIGSVTRRRNAGTGRTNGTPPYQTRVQKQRRGGHNNVRTLEMKLFAPA